MLAVGSGIKLELDSLVSVHISFQVCLLILVMFKKLVRENYLFKTRSAQFWKLSFRRQMYLDSGFHLLSFCCYLYGIWNEPSSLFLCHESDILQSNRNLSRKRINNFFRFKLFSIYRVRVHARRTQTLIPNTGMKYKQDFKGSCLHLLTFTASTPNLEQIKMIKERLPLLSY